MRRRLLPVVLVGIFGTTSLGIAGSSGAQPVAPQTDPALIESRVVGLDQVRTISKADEAHRVTNVYVKRDGRWIRHTFPLGHLETVASVTLPDGSMIDTAFLVGGGGGAPATRNLKKIYEKCYEYRKVDYHGFHCYRAYKPTVRDGSRRYNYRVFFWKGAGNARNERDLERMALGYVLESNAAEMTQNYEPQATRPDDCSRVPLTLSLSYKGAGASVGTEFMQCDTFFGPVPDNYGLKRFIFHWKGEKPGDIVVGMAGGAEFKFVKRKGYSGRRVHNYKADL